MIHFSSNSRFPAHPAGVDQALPCLSGRLQPVRFSLAPHTPALPVTNATSWTPESSAFGCSESSMRGRSLHRQVDDYTAWHSPVQFTCLEALLLQVQTSSHTPPTGQMHQQGRDRAEEWAGYFDPADDFVPAPSNLPTSEEPLTPASPPQQWAMPQSWLLPQLPARARAPSGASSPRGCSPSPRSSSSGAANGSLMRGGSGGGAGSGMTSSSSHLNNSLPSLKDFWTITDKPGLDLFTAGPTMGPSAQVYVILFGVGEKDTEGIYSLRGFGSDGDPHETIIAFECEEDAQRYAALLEASMDHTPAVCSILAMELVHFCREQAYSCRLEPSSSLLIPPDFNVGITDWERCIRLREGKFAVLDDEPERAPGSHPTPLHVPLATSSLGTLGGVKPAAAGGPTTSSLARYSQAFSGQELEDIRARLECLLPREDGPGGDAEALGR